MNLWISSPERWGWGVRCGVGGGGCLWISPTRELSGENVRRIHIAGVKRETFPVHSPQAIQCRSVVPLD